VNAYLVDSFLRIKPWTFSELCRHSLMNL